LLLRNETLRILMISETLSLVPYEQIVISTATIRHSNLSCADMKYTYTLLLPRKVPLCVPSVSLLPLELLIITALTRSYLQTLIHLWNS